jgi:hypothetical protein
MAARRIDELNNLITSVLVDPEDLNSPFKELKPVVLDLTPKGEEVGKIRGQPRLPMNGLIFLHRPDKRPIRGKCKDLSLTGLGACTFKKLKSFRLGERFKLEFAQTPELLQNVFIEVELTRVNDDPSGTNRIGLRFLHPNKRVKRRIHQFMAYLQKLDPW